MLLEKTDGEAYDKVNSVIHGDGLWAFVKLHAWFSRTTEAGITNRLIAIMKPEQCKKEFEVAAAVEKWEENYRRLREEHGVDELKESYKMAVVKIILTEEIKRHVELKEEEIKPTLKSD